jgi:hypothetical protein
MVVLSVHPEDTAALARQNCNWWLVGYTEFGGES